MARNKKWEKRRERHGNRAHIVSARTTAFWRLNSYRTMFTLRLRTQRRATGVSNISLKCSILKKSNTRGVLAELYLTRKQSNVCLLEDTKGGTNLKNRVALRVGNISLLGYDM